MSDQITIVGVIGTDPEHKHIGAGELNVTNFRVATTRRRRTEDGKWEDQHTNWYSVTCFRNLAVNVKTSLSKGQRVIVQGRLQIREFQRDDESFGRTVEIIANHVGADLTYATATVGSTSRSRDDQSLSSETQPASETAPAAHDWGAPVNDEALAVGSGDTDAQPPF